MSSKLKLFSNLKFSKRFIWIFKLIIIVIIIIVIINIFKFLLVLNSLEAILEMYEKMIIKPPI